MIVESVQEKAASPFRVLAAPIAVRSSVTCAAFSTVVAAISGLSVKLAFAENVAVTMVATPTVWTMQVPVPEQPPPLQPLNVEPVAGMAVKVTALPLANAAEHVAPQEIPAGLLVTLPVPAPVGLTVSVKVCTAKVAVTVVAAPSVTTQVPVPVQPPPFQPVKVEPAAGAAVRVTAVPLANGPAHAAPHEMPAGELVTVPEPAPALVTVSVKVCTVKVAVTVVAALSVTVQVPVPEHPPPLQPVKTEPAAGAAVRVTAVPLANEAAHVVPHERLGGELVTAPTPGPDLVTVSEKDCSANVALTVGAALIATVQD